MGDYDIDGNWNPQLASPVLPTVDEVEEDNYSTAQVRDMLERIAELEGEVAEYKKLYHHESSCGRTMRKAYAELRKLAQAAGDHTIGVQGCDELEALGNYLDDTK